MPTRTAFLILCTVAIVPGPGSAADDPDTACSTLAETTFELLNSALAGEHRARFKQAERGDSADDLSAFGNDDFIGDPASSLEVAKTRLETTLERLQQAETNGCLSREQTAPVRDRLSDANAIDGFLAGKVTGLGGQPVGMSADTYTAFLSKAIDFKKEALRQLIASGFGKE